MRNLLSALILTTLGVLPFAFVTTAKEIRPKILQDQVVSFETNAYPPFTVHGKDSEGRTVWLSSTEGTWGLEYDGEDRIYRMVDSEGNRITFARDSSGCVTEKRFERASGDSWTDLFACDANGFPVIEVIDSTSSGLGDIESQLDKLGLDLNAPQIVPTEEVRTDDKGITHSTYGPFATVHSWTPAGKSEILLRETSEVMGTQMTVETSSSADALIVTDDMGGWRRETYDEHGLTSVWDQTGRVVEIRRDSLGRPAEVLLGDLYALRYSYADSSPLWISKTLVQLADDSVTYSWQAATHPGEISARTHEALLRPRPAIRAQLPGRGTVAEWDSYLYPEGVAVIGLRGAPYALISLDQEKQTARSLTLVEPGAAWAFDRIDYTESAIALHLMTDGATKATAPVTVLLTFERQRNSTKPTTPLPNSDDPGAEGQRITVRLCGPDCICISRTEGGNETVEVRCPDSGGGSPGGGGGGGGGSGPTGGGGGGGSPPREWGTPPDPEMQVKLNNAKATASQRLQDNPQCRQLFSNLRLTNGIQVINATTYRKYEQSSQCQAANPAWTQVNWSAVFLCDRFKNLSSNRRAATIIHEALHSAGRKESPAYPGESTSQEIDDEVRAKCDL